MLLHVNDVTVLNVKTFISMIIKHETKKNMVSVPGLLGPTLKEELKHEYVLEIEFICGVRNKELKFTFTSPNHSRIEAMAKGVSQQLKNSDAGIVNQAFEDAFLKDR